MPKKDFAQIAREVVERAIGERLDGKPLPPGPVESAQAQHGRHGGIKGGRARANALTPEQRRPIARQAAKKRRQKHD